MKERPILFSAPMVRALLAGTKTQTRRAAKLTAGAHVKEPGGHRRWHPADPEATLACPYGQPGDLLWVRETWHDASSSLHSCALYRADGIDLHWDKWTPSIHMPRWASRITLEITRVRIERLQGISEADAKAEGIERATDFPGWYRHPLRGDSPGLADAGKAGKCPTAFPRLAFQALWESINGPASWDANPWVWAIEFRRLP